MTISEQGRCFPNILISFSIWGNKGESVKEESFDGFPDRYVGPSAERAFQLMSRISCPARCVAFVPCSLHSFTRACGL